MTILTFPTEVPAPSDMSFGLVANTQSGGRSPFDGTEQTLELPGSRWAAELRWRDLDVAEWRALTAFVDKLGGRAGRFTWSPIARFPVRGAGPLGGTPLVGAAGQTGKSLATYGWNGGNGTVVLRTGDMIGYTDPTGRSMLHRVTADATVSGGDQATLSLAPAIRRSPSANAPLNVSAPSPVWRLSRDEGMADYTPGDRGFSISLAIEESIW